MSQPTSRPPPAPVSPCADLLRILERIDRGADAEPSDLATARAHLAACPSCAAHHGRRLLACEGLLALRGREVPAGLLDGISAAVEANAPFAPLGGGMSQAFLDGPRALRAWRTAAVAAGLLLAVGGGFVATGRLAPRPEAARSVPILDARGALLEDVELPASPGSGGADPRISTVSWSTASRSRVSWPEHRPGQRFFWIAPAGLQRPDSASQPSRRYD